MIKKFGFTLTEVLITLSIVGVIAAMTVPTLMNKYQKEAQTVLIRKYSQEIANAIDMFITTEGKTSATGTTLFSNTDDFITSNLKITKTCEKDDSSCFGALYRSINNKTTASVNCAGKSYILANSSSICVTTISNSTSGTNSSNKPYLTIIMDTNAQEKPNIGGRDIFTFYVTKNGELAGTPPADLAESNCECDSVTGECTGDCGCNTSPLGVGCYTELEQNNWEMTY